jgi:hypothetical protein
VGGEGRQKDLPKLAWHFRGKDETRQGDAAVSPLSEAQLLRYTQFASYIFVQHHEKQFHLACIATSPRGDHREAAHFHVRLHVLK